jgi:outer membrane receptor protein involved in Fe transport
LPRHHRPQDKPRHTKFVWTNFCRWESLTEKEQQRNKDGRIGMNTKGKLMMATAIIAVAVAGPAAAQEQDRRGPDTTGGTGTEADEAFSGIPDIVVTARKIEERLQDAPVAVSVVSAETINQLGLNSLDDFARQTTGLSFSQAFGRSTDRPVIRGQSNVLAGVQAGVETGAAFFIDGVYYQGDIQGFDPQAIERVEVIKGPQSALYGRNTYAGAINYVTKDPTRNFTASGRARAAEHDEYELAGSISGPLLGEAAGFRLGARYFQYGGEYTNQLTGKKVGQEETKSAYLTLLIEPTSDIRIRPRIYWQKDDDGPLAIFLQGSVDNNCRPGFRSPAFRAASPFLPGAPARLRSETAINIFAALSARSRTMCVSTPTRSIWGRRSAFVTAPHSTASRTNRSTSPT